MSTPAATPDESNNDTTMTEAPSTSALTSTAKSTSTATAPSSNISTTAQQYQHAMSQHEEPPKQQHTEPMEAMDILGGIPSGDILMNNGEMSGMIDSPVQNNTSTAPSPAPPQRTGTPVRRDYVQEATSRAASQLPEPASVMPADAPPHGAPTRQYLNSKVTGALLDGMKQLAKDQPRDPLRVLGEFLIQRSKDLDGT